MPAVQEHKLTLEEFHSRYDGEKPYYEYWDGEAIQKSMPTGVHGVVQWILMRLLSGIGLKPASEVRLKLTPRYEPVPDVIAVTGKIPRSYPTTPFELVIEILSPGDSFSRTLRKCRLYEKWGIQRILIVDPEERIVWSFEAGSPVETELIAQLGDQQVTAATLWAELDRELE